MFLLNTVPLGPISSKFKYPLLSLNVVMIVWAIFMNYSFVHPTSKTMMWLRDQGYWCFTAIYVGLCAFAVLVGLINVCYVYGAFRDTDSLRMKKFRNATTILCCRSVPVHKAIGIVVLLVLGSYGLVSSIAFRDMFVRREYEHACSGYMLMAEVYVKSDFPSYDGASSSPIHEASSTIRFFKDGHHQYTMDLVRLWNQSLGFDGYNRDLQKDKSYNWGTFELATHVTEPEPSEAGTSGRRTEYVNMTKLVEDQSRGLNITQPGPIAKIHYDLRNLTYTMTFTNTSAPGFPPIVKSGLFNPDKKKMTFPDLELEQSDSDEWRFTDHVCLPPRLGMKVKYHVENAIHGEFALGCRLYR